MTFGDLQTDAYFLVIDADTSYKALLGRPWLHENAVVPSTLHQCFKYLKNGREETFYGERNPFTKEDAYTTDSQYFVANEEEEAESSPHKTVHIYGAVPPPLSLIAVSSDDEPCDFPSKKGTKAPAGPSKTRSRKKKTKKSVNRVACPGLPIPSYLQKQPLESRDQVAVLPREMPPLKPTRRQSRKKMLPGYRSEGFLNKDLFLVEYEWNRPISDKSDQEVPLQALQYGLPPGSPLFTKNGIGATWSKNRMQQYDDVWDIYKCRGLGGNRTDTRGLGYPEYIRDMRIKQVRSYLKKDRTTWVAETCVVSIHSYTSGSDDDGDSSPCSFPARRPTYQVERPISGSSDIPVVETTENEDSDTSSVSDPVMALFEQNLAPDWEVMLAPFKQETAYAEEGSEADNCSDKESSDDETLREEQPAPRELEEGTQATVDELVEVELGTSEDRRPTFVSALLSEKEKEESHYLSSIETASRGTMMRCQDSIRKSLYIVSPSIHRPNP